MLTIPTTIPALSVGDLTDRIQRALKTPQLQNLWVLGEISSANLANSGIYFALKDLAGGAMINCVVWQRQISTLVAKPKPGEQVYILGSLTLYAPQGKYQLQVQQILPAGEGLLALQLEQLRQKLRQAGLFDRQLPLPQHPRTIAVVTSPQAAAWGDIQRVIGSLYPGLRILLSPATVQGATAPRSIQAAIQRVVRDGRAEVVILARGGGSSEDLSCFNDELVVRAIAACPIPLVSGIGHERDESLAAPTPTAAAAAVVPNLADLVDDHRQRVERLQVAMVRSARQHQYRLLQLRKRWELVRPDRLLIREQERITRLKHRLRRIILARLTTAQQEQIHLGERLQALDPNLILQRGYALVRNQQGQILRDTTTVAVDGELAVELAQGSLRVKVLEVIYEE
jgi:exodeoxyribonuclease VII large subunit